MSDYLWTEVYWTQKAFLEAAACPATISEPVSDEAKTPNKEELEAKAMKKLMETYCYAYRLNENPNHVIELIKDRIADELNSALTSIESSPEQKEQVKKTILASADMMYDSIEQAKEDGLKRYNEIKQGEAEAKILSEQIMAKFDDKKVVVPKAAAEVDPEPKKQGPKDKITSILKR